MRFVNNKHPSEPKCITHSVDMVEMNPETYLKLCVTHINEHDEVFAPDYAQGKHVFVTNAHE